MARHTERSTLAACIATVVGVHVTDVPLEGEQRRAWLGERGLGLVPVADPPAFAWAGPWIALRPAVSGEGPRAAVMFGVPSGPIWDPARTTGEVLGGFVLAPHASAPVVQVTTAVAVAEQGLQGDRYLSGTGTFASGRPGSALTLVDAAVLDELEAQLDQRVDHRRNVVVRGTDLNALVGRRFRLGDTVCQGRRLCEPCAHLERLNDGGVLRPLVHRGGLRADIVTGGTVRVGDALVVT